MNPYNKWNVISMFPEISGQFIREFKNKVH